jgi:[acyl-carrier-protein] S-malonyltransferase
MQEAAAIAGDGVTFVELGPGKVLGGLLKRILDGANAVSLGTADDVSTFLETHA